MLPLKLVETCPDCGEVHTAPECAQGRKIRVVTPAPAETRMRLDLGDVTAAERAGILALSKRERLELLLKPWITYDYLPF